MNSRNGLAAAPGDRAGGSLLHGDEAIARERRSQSRGRLVAVSVIATVVAIGGLLGGIYLVAKGQHDAVREATSAEWWAMAGVIGLLALLIAIVIGGLAVIAYVARSHAIQGRLLAAERERSAAVQRFDLLFTHARDAILLLDADHRVAEANVAAETMYGWSRGELIGMHVDDFRTPETRAFLARDWADSRSRDGVLFETVHRRRDGTDVPVEVSSRVIEIDGKAYRQSIIRDITQRKAASDEVHAQLEELRRWSAATVGREHRIIALKAEVNELLAALGRTPRYEAELLVDEGEDA